MNGACTPVPVASWAILGRRVCAPPLKFNGTAPGSQDRFTSRHLKRFCQVGEEGQRLLEAAMERLGLSARAYDRVLKVARTIADLEQSGPIRPEHLAEAIQYRSLDRLPR